MIAIAFLADHPETIPALAKLFRAQWSKHYADWTQAEIEQDFLEDTSRDRLPCRLVAFEDDQLAGTIILREQNHVAPEYQPELGGLLVVESHRGHGIGTELVRAGMKLASDLEYETVYATTVSAVGILERLGWEFVKTISHDDEQLALYRCTL